jgi:hypothetical protein
VQFELTVDPAVCFSHTEECEAAHLAVRLCAALCADAADEGAPYPYADTTSPDNAVAQLLARLPTALAAPEAPGAFLGAGGAQALLTALADPQYTERAAEGLLLLMPITTPLENSNAGVISEGAIGSTSVGDSTKDGAPGGWPAFVPRRLAALASEASNSAAPAALRLMQTGLLRAAASFPDSEGGTQVTCMPATGLPPGWRAPVQRLLDATAAEAGGRGGGGDDGLEGGHWLGSLGFGGIAALSGVIRCACGALS